MVINKRCLLLLTYFLLLTGLLHTDASEISEPLRERIAKAHMLQDIFLPTRMVRLEQKENHLISEVDAAVVVKDNIVILDIQQRQLLQYTLDGSFIRSLGSTGNGPGEFQNPRYLAAIWGDQVAVVSDEGRLTVFDMAGQSTLQLSVSKGYFLPRGDFAWPTKDRIYITDFFAHGKRYDKLNLISDYSDLENPKSLTTFENRLPFIEEFGWRLPYTAFHLSGKRIYSASPYDSQIRVFDLDGKQVNAFRLNSPNMLQYEEFKDYLRKHGRKQGLRYRNQMVASIGSFQVVDQLLLVDTSKGFFVLSLEGERLSRMLPPTVPRLLFEHEKNLVTQLPLLPYQQHQNYYQETIPEEFRMMEQKGFDPGNEDEVWLRFGRVHGE